MIKFFLNLKKIISELRIKRSFERKTKKEKVKILLSLILPDSELTQPVYCDFVKSEEDANIFQKALPLVYIWNENNIDNTFSASINGWVIASLLEAFIARSNPDFNEVRDEVLSTMRKISIPAILKVCEEANAMPSVVFARCSKNNISIEKVDAINER